MLQGSQKVLKKIKAFPAPISTKLVNDQHHYMCIPYEISSKSYNKCGRCRYKFIYDPKKYVALTAPIFLKLTTIQQVSVYFCTEFSHGIKM
jgi:hypothetical protein